MRTLVFDIGGTKFTAALFAGDQMIHRESRSTDREGGREWMAPKLIEIAQKWLPFDRCGIGFGGPVDFSTQQVVLSTHVGGWEGFDLCGYVRNALNVPVVMDNDANVGALGEAHHGAGKGFDPLFYMTLSTGIGGGIVHNGKIYRGADSYAGEIGHLTIRPEGPECLCGAHGCFERMCCGLWMERDTGRPAQELLQDDTFIPGYVENLALGLKSAIMILNPARIIIGGGISKAGDRLFGPLRTELRRRITQWSRARIDVVPASLADDAVLFGALELSKELL